MVICGRFFDLGWAYIFGIIKLKTIVSCLCYLILVKKGLIHSWALSYGSINSHINDSCLDFLQSLYLLNERTAVKIILLLNRRLLYFLWIDQIMWRIYVLIDIFDCSLFTMSRHALGLLRHFQNKSKLLDRVLVLVSLQNLNAHFSFLWFRFLRCLALQNTLTCLFGYLHLLVLKLPFEIYCRCSINVIIVRWQARLWVHLSFLNF